MERLFALAMLTFVLLCSAVNAAETELVGSQTVWRVWTVQGPYVGREQDKKLFVIEKDVHRDYIPQSARLTELPPAGWTESGVDDGKWIRRTGRELSDQMGGVGLWSVPHQPGRAMHPALLLLRTRFGVSDPAKATDLKVTLEYLGGAIVYVNGVEVGRGHMPGGTIDPYAVADDYPIEAYVADDGKSLLPSQEGEYGIIQLIPKWSSRYQARVRTLTVDVPAKVLVKGVNVLTVDLRRAPVCGPLPEWRAWGHVGFRAVGMTSASGGGVIDPLKSTRVWSAQEAEQFMAQSVTNSRVEGKASLAASTLAVTGRPASPFDPVDPLQIMASRGGVGNGVVVLSCPDGLRGVKANIGKFTGPGGATLPARIRFAARDEDIKVCDAFLDTPPDGRTNLPVWIEARVPQDQALGCYEATLTLEANGGRFFVPARMVVEDANKSAVDWTGFLGGPLRTAHVGEGDLLKNWPDEGPRLLWNAKGLGGGYPEVLVVGDAVFTLGCIGKIGNLQCLDRLTGQVRWRQVVPGIGASTPAWVDDRLYLYDGHGLQCHDAKTGAFVWRADLNKLMQDNGVKVGQVPGSDYASAWVQSPLAHRGMVIVFTGQSNAVAMAVDAQTGKLKWISKGSREAIGHSYSSASLVRCGSREVVLAPCFQYLVGMDVNDGKVLWEERCFPTKAARFTCPPVFNDGLLYIVAGYWPNEWSTYRLSGDGSTIEKVWNRRRLDPRQENVVLVDGVMYGRGFVTWSDIESNTVFRYEGKTLGEQPPELANRWRSWGSKNPNGAILEAVLVGQDLKTGNVLGAISFAGIGGHGGALVTAADHRLYVAASGQPDAIRLIEPAPVMKVVGTLRPPFAELLKKHNQNGSSGGGWGGYYTRPQVSHGCLWVRVQDQLLVYDLRQH